MQILAEVLFFHFPRESKKSCGTVFFRNEGTIQVLSFSFFELVSSWISGTRQSFSIDRGGSSSSSKKTESGVLPPRSAWRKMLDPVPNPARTSSFPNDLASSTSRLTPRYFLFVSQMLVLTFAGKMTNLLFPLFKL
jgi:hypothetical protein